MNKKTIKKMAEKIIKIKERKKITVKLEIKKKNGKIIKLKKISTKPKKCENIYKSVIIRKMLKIILRNRVHYKKFSKKRLKVLFEYFN